MPTETPAEPLTEHIDRTVRRYGWKPSLPGVKMHPADTSGIAILDHVDPRAELPSVFDQLDLGSCTANATGAAFQYDAMLDGKLKATDYLSRLWIYWQERKIEGTLAQGDCGAMGSDAFIAAEQVGVPLEKDWPYVTAKFNPKAPPAKAKKDAKANYLLTKQTHLVDQTEIAIKQVLSNKQTIAFGFTVKESFEDQSWWATGKMPVPHASEQVLGGHEILMVGFLQEFPGYIMCRNSWNKIYGGEAGGVSPGGKDGYFLFPISQIINHRVCSDLRTIVRPLA